FIDGISSYCRGNQLSMDVTSSQPLTTALPRAATATPTANAVQSFPLFDQGLSVEQVAERMGRAISTVFGYLESYIRHRKVRDVSPWLSREEFNLVKSDIQDVGGERLRPIFDALDGRVGYEQIRIVLASIKNSAGDPAVHEAIN